MVTLAPIPAIDRESLPDRILAEMSAGVFRRTEKRGYAALMAHRLECVLVDDDVDWLGLMQRSIARTGLSVNVTTFLDGLAALEHLRHHVVDFVVTDLCMPRMDGLTLIQEIRTFAPATPIILVSTVESVADEALARGANFFIGKRNLYLQLTETLQELFQSAEKPLGAAGHG